ncbi:MAG TPA: hypothetical protein VFV95_07615 [Vicinamibacterales bacterium]|nr:hypothetical protein [Vicinamibacterales bacterium]
MRRELDALAREIAWAVPGDLAAAAARLEQSGWPEVVDRWSRLTPTGFPIELTVAATGTVRRWTAEIAGPEIADGRRLDMIAAHMAGAGQPVATPLLEQLRRLQAAGTLRYGAWLGGRPAADAAACYKLYAEVPRDARFDDTMLPPALRTVAAHMPRATRVSMIGCEPARGRLELYCRLPVVDAEDLRPVLRAAGCDRGVEALDLSLPDGTRRLAGRQLGLSIAVDDSLTPEITLLVSARSLFPGSPRMLHTLLPGLAAFPMRQSRPTLVAMGMSASASALTFAVGMTTLPHTSPEFARIEPGATTKVRPARNA